MYRVSEKLGTSQSGRCRFGKSENTSARKVDEVEKYFLVCDELVVLMLKEHLA